MINGNLHTFTTKIISLSALPSLSFIQLPHHIEGLRMIGGGFGGGSHLRPPLGEDGKELGKTSMLNG